MPFTLCSLIFSLLYVFVTFSTFGLLLLYVCPLLAVLHPLVHLPVGHMLRCPALPCSALTPHWLGCLCAAACLNAMTPLIAWSCHGKRRRPTGDGQEALSWPKRWHDNGTIMLCMLSYISYLIFSQYIAHIHTELHLEFLGSNQIFYLSFFVNNLAHKESFLVSISSKNNFAPVSAL